MKTKISNVGADPDKRIVFDSTEKGAAAANAKPDASKEESKSSDKPATNGATNGATTGENGWSQDQ